MSTHPSALPHVERIIAACLELGAKQTTEQTTCCWETTSSFGAPSHHFIGDTAAGDFRTDCDDDVTKHVMSWPEGNGPTAYELACAVLPADAPDLARGEFVPAQRVDFVELWIHPELTVGNGRNHRGIVVAVMRQHTRLVSAARLDHFVTDKEGHLHVGQFA